MILCLKNIYLRITSTSRGHERDMHKKLCAHAQFSVLMVCNSPLAAKLTGRDENEIDIAFEDKYNSIELK
jgi:hypothetical protein